MNACVCNGPSQQTSEIQGQLVGKEWYFRAGNVLGWKFTTKAGEPFCSSCKLSPDYIARPKISRVPNLLPFGLRGWWTHNFTFNILLLLVLLGFTTTDSINILLLRLQATQFSFIAQVLREDLVVALAWYFFQAVFPVKPRQKSALPDQRRLLFFLCDVKLGRARNLTLFAVLLRSCSCVVTNTCFIPYYGRRC